MALLPLLALAHASVILKVSVVLASLRSCCLATNKAPTHTWKLHRLLTTPWTPLLRFLQSLVPASAFKEWRET